MNLEEFLKNARQKDPELNEYFFGWFDILNSESEMRLT